MILKFKWIARKKVITDENQQQTWLKLVDIKDHIVAQLDSENDGFVVFSPSHLEI